MTLMKYMDKFYISGYTQVGGCIRSEEILDAKKKEIVRDIDDRTLTAYITLPVSFFICFFLIELFNRLLEMHRCFPQI